MSDQPATVAGPFPWPNRDQDHAHIEPPNPSWAEGNVSTTAATERYGVPDDPETTEQLRTQLIAITEAERKALNDAACYIAASSHLPGVQGLAGAVLNVANRGGVNAD